jgi:hypothetical protein
VAVDAAPRLVTVALIDRYRHRRFARGGDVYREIILQALEERRVLDLSYAGSAPYAIQPHAIVRKSDGTELLEAYQVSGFGEDFAEHGWKTIDMSRVELASLRPERFEPRRDFRPVTGGSAQVIAQVRGDVAPEL